MSLEIARDFVALPDETFIPPNAKFHPAFADGDADILLCSCDNVLFRVHSLVLRLASGWFRTLFTLPQSPSCKLQQPRAELIHMVEPADVIAALLSMASGKELPRLDSLERVEELLHAAEKFDMAGALSILRLAICSSPILDAHPIRVYGIACQWGWHEQAKVAAAKTIGVDLFSCDAVKDLGTVDSPYLTRLLVLHRRRREELKAGLDSPNEFYANSTPGRCANCQRDVTHVAWLKLKYAWVAAIEKCPGEVASGAVLQRPEIHELLGAACQHCQRKLYNADGTITKLRAILDRLPTTVEVRDHSYALSPKLIATLSYSSTSSDVTRKSVSNTIQRHQYFGIHAVWGFTSPILSPPVPVSRNIGHHDLNAD